MATSKKNYKSKSNIDLFDRIVDVYITPGTNLTRNNNGPVLWDIYDLITIETVP